MEITQLMIKRFNLLLISLFITFTANASGVGGPPTPSEIIGLWKMVPLSNPEINKINPWPSPYQWFAFYKDGRVASMGQTEDIDFSRNELQSILDEVKNNAPTYTWQNNFLIISQPGSSDKNEVWGVNIFRKDTSFAKTGDLIMTLAGGITGAPVYYRHLTPIN